MNDLSYFSIQNPKQIINRLSLLVKNRCQLGASFGTNNESYITTILDINEQNNTVEFDCEPNDDLIQYILKAGEATFDTDYKGIKVSFTGAGLKRISPKGAPVFSVAIPESLLWLERREYYRVESPLSKPSYCQFIIEGRKPVYLRLYDISLTGCALLNVSNEISELMIPGTTIRDCKLILPGEVAGMISFEVCTKYIIDTDKFKNIQKIGCKFINLTNQLDEAIHRYMLQIQRKDLRKE